MDLRNLESKTAGCVIRMWLFKAVICDCKTMALGMTSAADSHNEIAHGCALALKVITDVKLC